MELVAMAVGAPNTKPAFFIAKASCTVTPALGFELTTEVMPAAM